MQGDHKTLNLAVLELGLKEVGEGGQGHPGRVDNLFNDNDDEDGDGDAMILIPVIMKIMMVVTGIRIPKMRKCTSPASSLSPDLRTVSPPSLAIRLIETVSAACEEILRVHYCQC